MPRFNGTPVEDQPKKPRFAGAPAPSQTIQTMLSGMEHPAPVAEAEWFPDSDQWPGQTLAKESVSALSSGIENIPNVVPNVVNTAKSLYDLHQGGTGEVAPEDQWQPWMGKEGFVDYPFTPTSELHPPTPGWETFRRYGEMAGSAAPAGPIAMALIPALSAGGGEVGGVIDRSAGYTNDRWRKSLEVAGPLVTGLGVKALRSKPVASFAETGVSLTGPAAGLATWVKTGDPVSSLLAAEYAPKVAQQVVKGVEKFKPTVRPVADVLEGGGIANTLARALVPMAQDDPRMRGRR